MCLKAYMERQSVLCFSRHGHSRVQEPRPVSARPLHSLLGFQELGALQTAGGGQLHGQRGLQCRPVRPAVRGADWTECHVKHRHRKASSAPFDRLCLCIFRGNNEQALYIQTYIPTFLVIKKIERFIKTS